MFKVCFVCLGNICRSPTAEVVMRAKLRASGLADQVAVSSAGTGDWHVGSGVDARAAEALAAGGYDGFDDHSARQFDPAWFDDLDLVIALDRENLAALRRLTPADQRDQVRLLRSFDPTAGPDDLEVPDPYYGGSGGFERVLGMVERACDGLVGYIREQLG
ncbi:MAG TPA: low molecular weight protein-tyrosine-phosphatase [Mycobacteriales bacterium]|nr:low molecular weight protein-tyrosine-phosphatase [Mycobacteriales bacterium]